ncbi:hypothetical protein VIN7_10557 [Saccharomyces cerevisiae x Saccharomyces kudriavzevii VIN7]|uniref:Uncharacterized protein n=1 Tax=Saccharomyces cerevisiae x Saccharomyces kudriavzevii (strain VIN7) TaxID=1095631 RepID=H0H2I9_SACCK|nr:hypothetical protein VIN7_10557 [Saccharomyces cerevisiae x Saccharomyces kudriavzevii VIN7]
MKKLLKKPKIYMQIYIYRYNWKPKDLRAIRAVSILKNIYTSSAKLYKDGVGFEFSPSKQIQKETYLVSYIGCNHFPLNIYLHCFFTKCQIIGETHRKAAT